MKKAWMYMLMTPLIFSTLACSNARQSIIPSTMTSTNAAVSSGTEINDTLSATLQTDFSLLFRYGAGWTMEDGANFSGNYNELDTSNGTYTKDMVSAAPITINLSLTQEELDSIYNKMMEIDFFNYPDTFYVAVPFSATTTFVTPSQRYYFRVTNGSQVKELFWNDKILNQDSQASRLRNLIQLIKNIIASKDDYKTLPPASGGYL
jgi:hypothetical protein